MKRSLHLLYLIGITCQFVSAQIVHNFFIPIPEEQAHISFETINDDANNTLHSILSIVVTKDSTIIYFDHWEDVYESDITVPTQSSTEIWGDNNPANGIPPGYGTDVLNEGSVIALENDVAIPRNPSVILYDGRDKLASTGELVLTKSMWPTDPGSLFGGASEIFDVSSHNLNYEVPVGEDITPGQLFEYSGLTAMASENGTFIRLDINGDGIADDSLFLNQGESHLVNGGILTGATVNADKPVQVHLLTGDRDARYESRWFSLFPRELWDDTYYSPVSTTDASDPNTIFLYNAGPDSIMVNYTTLVSTGSILIYPGEVEKYVIPEFSGAEFTSPGNPFYAVGAIDSDNGNNQVHDWGFTLIPSLYLSPLSTVGWGPGSRDLSANASPVWVIATRSTRLYVDLDGDPSTGPKTDPNGDMYNDDYDVDAYESLRIFDNTDNDQTGIHLYTLDNTEIAVAWGQDPSSTSTTATNNPILDLGTAVLPLRKLDMVKVASLSTDFNSNGLVDPGDIITYQVILKNRGSTNWSNLNLQDLLPPEVTYLANTTRNNGFLIPDDATPPAATVFPLDESGYLITFLPGGQYDTISFDVSVNTPPPFFDEIINQTFLSSSGLQTLSVAQVSIPVVTPSLTNCSASFTNEMYSPVAIYAENELVCTEVDDNDQNTDGGSIETIEVIIQSSLSGDRETLILTETSANSGLFRGCIPSSSSGGETIENGILHAVGGENLNLSYTDVIYGETCTDNAAISIPTLTKSLYLTSPGLSLDRIDPDSTNDLSTATVTLGNANCEIVTNNEFDNGTSDWSLFNQSGNSSTWSVDNTSQLSGLNSAKVEITTASGTDWHIQLAQETFPLTAGQEYVIYFDAKAASSRTIAVQIQERQSPWSVYQYQSVNLTTTATTYGPFSFTPTVNETIAGILFNLGTSTETVYIDNVHLTTSCSAAEGSWQYKRKLTFGNGSQAENLTDFPVLVKLDNTRIDYLYAQNSGQDIRFYDADGTTQLAHEIEEWNPSGDSYVWVQVPQIDGSSSTDYIWMIYGDQSVSDGQDPINVWNNGYEAVWHMSEDPTGPVLNSAGNNFNLITNVGMDAGDLISNGQIGPAMEFDNATNYLQTSTGINEITLSSFTMEAWVRADNWSDWRTILNVDDGVDFFDFGAVDADPMIDQVDNGSEYYIGPTQSGSTWRHIVGTYDDAGASNRMRGFINGSITPQINNPNLTTVTGRIIVGAYNWHSDGQYYDFWDGAMDEVRISNVPRSEDWITAQYLSMTDAFITYGAQEVYDLSSSIYLDEITNLTYDGSNGTADWSTSPWVEESDGSLVSTTGAVAVRSSSNAYGGTGNTLKTSLDHGNSIEGLTNVYREADLSALNSGYLSYYLRHTLTTDDTIALEISDNGGSSWSVLKYHTASDADPSIENFDISAFLSSNTRIRFRLINIGTGGGGAIWTDNVRIGPGISSLGSSTIFRQLEPVCADFDMPAGGSIQVQVYINPDTINMGSVQQAVGTANDDAEEEGPGGDSYVGFMYRSSTDMELVTDAEDPKYGVQKVGLRFTDITVPAGATITNAYLSFRAIDADAPNTNTGTTNLTIKGEDADNPGTFLATDDDITDRVNTADSVNWVPASWTTGNDYDSPDLSPIVQEIVDRGGWSSGNSMVFIITGTGSRSSPSYEGDPSNTASLTIEYTTSDPFPVAPDITAVLKHNNTIFTTLTTPTYDKNSGTLTWAEVLGSAITIPSGDTIKLEISSNETADFDLLYDSDTKPSRIDLPTSTAIVVTEHLVYDAPYPGGTPINGAVNGETVFVRATVSDPFGYTDITSLDLIITDPADIVVIDTTLTNMDVVDTAGCIKTYEFSWTTGVEEGVHIIDVAAHEGYESILDSAQVDFTLHFDDLGTPCQLDFTDASMNPVTGYTAGSNICIKVSDIDENSNPVLAESIFATLTSSTGDSESVMLTETGVNTGIFFACIPSSAVIVGSPDDGTLYAPAGDIITSRYIDADEGTDICELSVLITSAVPLMNMAKSLVTPSDGSALAGEFIQFDIYVTNPGPTTLVTVTLNDLFTPACMIFDSASIVPDSISAGSLAWNNIGPILPGGSQSVRVYFTAIGACNPSVNFASANGMDENTTPVSAGPVSDQVVITEPGLVVSKSVIDPMAGLILVGDTITYQIDLDNQGSTEISSLPVSDYYSAYCLEFVSSVHPADGAGGGTVLWNDVGPLASGNSTSITVTFKVLNACDPAVNAAEVRYAVDENGDPVPPARDKIETTITGPPVAVDDSEVTEENTAVIILVLANDTDPNGDIDNSSLDTAGVLQPTDGTLALNLISGRITYTPDPGFVGVDQFEYIICDFTGLCDTALVVVIVNCAGIVGQNNIYGAVFKDNTQNGIYDPFESGQPGVTILLYEDINRNGWIDGVDVLISSYVTDANGDYAFSPSPGSYPVHYLMKANTGDLPAGSYLTTAAVTSAIFTANGQSDCNNDFGFYCPICNKAFTNPQIMYYRMKN